ncbi:choice-of-anchor M domain-containing protein [Kineosporia sp. J2-2]|uniref:Choice-of-anchor M domain-containing protein n=1 Tax=Kineosporia corallincola TaxID=2835133 RepID=A0ABS5TTA3_9ACTN|nr:choice-of-anchor M domain-containing protein [Kineosporia corallincola]MBT0774032.1 choice-of-anchor M domain-containing protein [Kineosporia corallincola]
MPGPARRSRTAGALLLIVVPVVVLISAWTAGSSYAAVWNGRLVLDSGHVDAVHVTLDGERLSVRLREDVTGSHVLHDAQDVVLQVGDAARFAIPDVPGFEFLGPEGASTWLIPEVQEPDVVWAGWDTEEIETGELRDDAITMELSEVEGPGTVHIFNNGPVGEAVMLFDPQSGLRTHSVPVNAHVHANWAFSAPGSYELTFRASAVTAAGTPVQGSATYQFVVGDLPDAGPSPSDPGTTPTTTETTPAPTDPSTTTPDPTTPDPTTPAPSPTDSASTPPTTEPCPDDPPSTEPSTGGTPKPTGSSPTEPPDGGGHYVTQSIRATIGDDDGGLVLSVDPQDRSVTLPAATLDPSGNHWSSGGELRPVTVTDTRTGSPGWNASGQISDFTGDTGQFPGKHLGWTPRIITQPSRTTVTPGAIVAPALATGDGLTHSSTLATATAGTGRGVTVLGAALELTVPADVETGDYRATLTLTVI